LVDGQAVEKTQLETLGASKNTQAWRPSQADMDSAAFKVVVGAPKFTPRGKPVGVIVDSVGLEIKAGRSALGSTYQLRLMTYRSLVVGEPLTIRTSRPVMPAFRDWLSRWGVSVTGF
jgi:hypothetical protein